MMAIKVALTALCVVLGAIPWLVLVGDDRPNSANLVALLLAIAIAAIWRWR